MNDETLGNGCLFAGPGRGDCEHFVGYPSSVHRPGMHGGPDDTVDEYGKPNGWCWSCWRSRQIQELRKKIEEQKELIDHLNRRINYLEIFNPEEQA